MSYDSDIPIPKWLVKGITKELPDGNIVTFAGKNPKDYCIIVKDREGKIHANFVLKPDEYELHLKNEKTNEKRSLFETYASVITDITKYWQDKHPEYVKIFAAKHWQSHDEFVVDVNSTEIPMMKWRDGIYNIEPETLFTNSVPKERILRLKFSMGILFDGLGNCQGMLMRIRKQKKLVLIKMPLFEKIMDTIIGMDWVRNAIKQQYEEMQGKD